MIANRRKWQIEKMDFRGKVNTTTENYIIYEHSQGVYGVDYDVEMVEDKIDIRIIDGKEYRHTKREFKVFHGKELNETDGYIVDVDLPEIGFKIKFIDVSMGGYIHSGLQSVYEVSTNEYVNTVWFLYEHSMLPKYVKIMRGDNHSANYNLIRGKYGIEDYTTWNELNKTIKSMELNIPLYGYGFNNSIYYSVCLKYIISIDFKGFEMLKEKLISFLKLNNSPTSSQIAKAIDKERRVIQKAR